MTTIRQLVTDAFRESGITQTGLDPESDEFDEGLRKAQFIIQNLLVSELGCLLTPVSYGSASLTNASALYEDQSSFVDQYFVPPFSRLMVNIDTPVTVYLPPNPMDGTRVGVVDSGSTFGSNTFTINGNGRKIEGAFTKTLSDDGVSREWFYRADTGNWSVVSSLTSNDESPFPFEFDDLISTQVAMRLNPRYEQQTAPETISAYRTLLSRFKARYKTSVEVGIEEGLIRFTHGNRGYYSIPIYYFNQGRIL
jgi:hypothetical protein